jgi:hypothetical protein
MHRGRRGRKNGGEGRKLALEHVLAMRERHPETPNPIPETSHGMEGASLKKGPQSDLSLGFDPSPAPGALGRRVKRGAPQRGIFPEVAPEIDRLLLPAKTGCLPTPGTLPANRLGGRLKKLRHPQAGFHIVKGGGKIGAGGPGIFFGPEQGGDFPSWAGSGIGDQIGQEGKRPVESPLPDHALPPGDPGRSHERNCQSVKPRETRHNRYPYLPKK